MDFTAHTSPPIDTSLWSSVQSSPPSFFFFSLCPSAATHFFLPSVYVLLFITALPGNALSLWVFLRCISTISPTHIYLCHLSISNLMLSLTTPFVAAYFSCGTFWTLTSVLCQLVLHGITPVLHINMYIGIMILTWLALSRFAALMQHTHASRPSTCITLLPHGFFTCLKRVSFARKVCAAIWLVAVGGTVPVTIYYSVKEATSGDSAGEDVMCYNPAVEVGGGLSTACSASEIIGFFVCYLLVLLSYMSVLKHIWRSRRSTNVMTSQSLLGRVFRNIVVIQVVLSVCLLPYHIYKPIFIFLAYKQHQVTNPTESGASCHPLSTHVEVKNSLFLLAALRGSTDPVMYFLLDNTFRKETLRLFGFDNNSTGNERMCSSVTDNQKSRQQGDRNEQTTKATLDSSHVSVL